MNKEQKYGLGPYRELAEVPRQTKTLSLEKILTISLKEYFGGEYSRYLFSYDENRSCNYLLKEIKIPAESEYPLPLNDIEVPKNTIVVVSYKIERKDDGQLYHTGITVIGKTGKCLREIIL